MKSAAILGSTGSIGTQTLDVIRMHPDRLKVTALACGSDWRRLEEQIREFRPKIAAVYDETAARALRAAVADLDVRIFSGMDGLIEMCTDPGSEIVVTAIVGMIGILPTIAAIRSGKDIALANKETLVTAGHIIMPLARECGVRILPVDSEHSAIFQALQGKADSKIRRILLTASGGPFRHMSREELERVTVKEALSHPTWSMGPKVTIDSASMVNKGLEVIEARWLFDVDPDQIEVLIQPQSIVHSMVEYEDYSVIAQLGVSDMRIPIQYALLWPDHMPSPSRPMDFRTLKSIEFDVPRNDVFRGLPLALRAVREGGSVPCVFNAANEWANACFRSGRIRFLDIYRIIEDVMAYMPRIPDPSVEEILGIQEEVDAYCGAHFC